jgi:chromosome segregation ATPase
MKIKNLHLKNFGTYNEVNVEFDNNVTYLIGKNGAGKSTMGLTAIWGILGGIAEKNMGKNLIGERFRFIGNNGQSAVGELTIIDEKRNNAEIKIIRKITRTGNEVDIQAPDNYKIDQEWLNNIFNLFLISPKRFIQLTPKEQAIALGINVDEIDSKIKEVKSEITASNNQVKRLQPTVVKEPQIKEEINVVSLNNRYAEVDEELHKTVVSIVNVNRIQMEIAQLEKEDQDIIKQIAELQEKITALTARKNQIAQIIPEKKTAMTTASETNVKLNAKKDELLREKEDLSVKIQNAGNLNTEFKLYASNKKAYDEAQKSLQTQKDKLENLQNERMDKIKSCNLPFTNMSISEDGELMLDGKLIKEPYFSTGELIKIVPIIMASLQNEPQKDDSLKYVFVQDFNLLDEDKQTEIEQYLTSKGFQLVIEVVGKNKIDGKNCILLKDSQVVESYDDKQTSKLSI